LVSAAAPRIADQKLTRFLSPCCQGHGCVADHTFRNLVPGHIKTAWNDREVFALDKAGQTKLIEKRDDGRLRTELLNEGRVVLKLSGAHRVFQSVTVVSWRS
jgi:hypothetical protein